MPFPAGRLPSERFVVDFKRIAFTCEWCQESSSSTSRLATFCQKPECQHEYNRRRLEEKRLKDRGRKREGRAR